MKARGAQGQAKGLPGWLKRTRAEQAHIDPYTVWALHSDFRSFSRNGQLPAVLDFLVELHEPYDPARHLWPGLSTLARVEVPAIYVGAIPGTLKSARHITVRLHLEPGQDGRAAALSLMRHADVKRAQVGIPQPALPTEPCPPIEPAAGAKDKVTSRPRVVIGVLEDGCPFAHQALRDPRGHTRVAALWDQSAVRAVRHDPAPAALGYGRERDSAQLHALMNRYTRAGRVDEERLYTDPAALQRRVRLSYGSHAAAVLGLLAGDVRQLPSLPQKLARRTEDSLRAAAKAPDPAAAAPLVVVQLPREQIDVAGSRWFTVRALDGLRYILAQATRLGGRAKPVPLVVNVSYGSIAGAHDGTALLECAMGELVQAHGAMAIVLAAGNAAGGPLQAEGVPGLVRKPRGFHAEAPALAAQQAASFRVFVPPEMLRETYVEIWFDNPKKGGEDFLQAGDVQIDVLSPTGQRLRVSRWPGTDFIHNGSGLVSSGLLAFRRTAQSLQRSMALLVIGATGQGCEPAAAAAGEWTVKVHNRSGRTLNVQAWVERDWVPRTGQPAQRAFLRRGPSGEVSFELNDRNTLNNIATGPGVVRVGATMALGDPDRPKPKPSHYSSETAPGSRPVEFQAIADQSPAQLGVRVSGNLSGSVNRMNGTSIAAPQVARRLANQLALGFPLETQVPSQKGAHKKAHKKGPAAPAFGTVVLP